MAIQTIKNGVLAVEIDEASDGTFDVIGFKCSSCGVSLTAGTVHTCLAGSFELAADDAAEIESIADNGGSVAELEEELGLAGSGPAVAGTSVVPAPVAKAPPTPEEIEARRVETNRMLAMMGLEPEDEPAAIAAESGDALAGAMVTDEGEAEAPATANAVVCDEFSQYKGRMLNKAAEFDLPKLKLEDHVIEDLYAVSYESEVKLAKRCTDAHRADFVSALLDCQETQAVRMSTVGDPVASEIAAAAFAGRLKKYLVEVQPDPSKAPPCKTGGGRGRDLKAQIDCMVAAAGAAKSAAAAVQDYEDAKDMLGSDQAGKMDPKRAADMYARIRKSKKLIKIAELAGRYRRVAAAKQKNKTVHGTDDVVGVTVGGDAFKLIPSELANFCHPLLRLEVLSKLVENRAMVWDQRGTEPVAKGPIVVVVDESGSMEDGSRNADGTVTAKVEQAKALALAMAWIAAKQKRFCALVGFSGGTQGTLTILPPGKWDETKILDWLEHFFGCGTDMDVPMKELPEVYWPKIIDAGAQRGKTDIVIITDGIVNMPEKIEKRFVEWKKAENVKLYSIVLHSSAGDLKRVSDTTHLIDRDMLNANSEAVAQVLSV